MMEYSYYTKEKDVRIQAGNIYYPQGTNLPVLLSSNLKLWTLLIDRLGEGLTRDDNGAWSKMLISLAFTSHWMLLCIYSFFSPLYNKAK